MKDCFGIHFGFFEGGMAGKPEDRQKCYDCPDFDKCYKIALIQSLTALKLEIRTGVMGLKSSLGGSHTDFPMW